MSGFSAISTGLLIHHSEIRFKICRIRLNKRVKLMSGYRLKDKWKLNEIDVHDSLSICRQREGKIIFNHLRQYRGKMHL